MEFSDLFYAYGHIVEKILGYVENTYSASVACKTFYKAVCRKEKFNKILNISQTRIQQHFNSIINTGRQFNEIVVASDGERALSSDDSYFIVAIEQITKVAHQFGENITKARIHPTLWIINHQFVNLLNTMPHLIELSLYDVDRIVIQRGDKLNLHKLSILDFSNFRLFDQIEDFVDLLPDDVLQSIRVPFIGPVDHSNLFVRQRNIKKLKLPLLFEVHTFHNVKLEELSIEDDCRSITSLYKLNYDELLEILELQPQLLKLEISEPIEKPMAVYICTTLTQLQSLSISIRDGIVRAKVLPTIMSNLSNLNHLKELKLRSYEFDIPTLTLVQQPKIKKLFLHTFETKHHRTDIDDAGLMLLKQAFPSLIEIGLKNFVPFNIPELLNVFADIETLSLRIFEARNKQDLFEMTRERSHENIKNFFLTFHHTTCEPIDIEFQKFCSIMSNLESLELWNPKYFLNDVNGLNVLKNKLTKLKKLNLFETDSYGSISYPKKGSIVSPYMF